MFYLKKHIFLLFIGIFTLFIPVSVTFGAMSGAGYSIFADTFSSLDDSGASTGGTYSLRSTGGEFGAGIVQTTASGTLSVNAPNIFFFGETFTLSDGVTSRIFEFRNLAGDGNGTVVGDHVIVDTGGGGGTTAAGMAIRIRDAINDPDAGLTIGASSLGSVVTVINTVAGVAGNVPISETVGSGDFVVAGMSGGGDGYSLRGGFQAMERGSSSLSFSTSSIHLRTLSLVAVASSSMQSTISTDSGNGYSLTVDEDGNLRSGANDINDVIDGEVSVGSEEYGLQTVGGGGLLLGDTAITNGLEVASSEVPVINEETSLIFHASIAQTSKSGAYSHTITATLTANP